MVRAKFKVSEIIERGHYDINKGNLFVVKLSPVTSGSEENKRFYEATPTGTIELGTLNTEVGKLFTVGQEYYVDFVKAPPP